MGKQRIVKECSHTASTVAERLPNKVRTAAEVEDFCNQMVKAGNDVSSVCLDANACTADLDQSMRGQAQGVKESVAEKQIEALNMVNIDEEVENIAREKGLKGKALKKLKENFKVDALKKMNKLKDTFEDAGAEMSEEARHKMATDTVDPSLVMNQIREKGQEQTRKDDEEMRAGQAELLKKVKGLTKAWKRDRERDEYDVGNDILAKLGASSTRSPESVSEMADLLESMNEKYDL